MTQIIPFTLIEWKKLYFPFFRVCCPLDYQAFCPSFSTTDVVKQVIAAEFGMNIPAWLKQFIRKGRTNTYQVEYRY